MTNRSLIHLPPYVRWFVRRLEELAREEGENQ